VALIFINIIIISLGFAIGDFIADYFYYDIFHRIDFFQGPSLFRIILTLIFEGVMISFFFFINIKVILIKNKTYSYILIYSMLILLFIGKPIYYNYFIYGMVEKFDLMSYILYFLSKDFLFPVAILLSSFFITTIILNFIFNIFYKKEKK